MLTFVDVTDPEVAQEAHRVSDVALRTSEARLSRALAGAPLAELTHDNKLEPTWAFVERYANIVREIYGKGVAQRAELDVVSDGSVRAYHEGP